jgi:hypothetical protein
MALHFQAVTHPPLANLTATAPDHAIIGLTGLKGSGIAKLLRLAAALETPASGAIEGPPNRRLIQFGEPLNFAPVDVLALDGALAAQDPLVRERACLSLERLRRAGATILLSSHDPLLLTRLCDEVWWLDAGRLAAQGDPRAVLPQYSRHITAQLLPWGRSLSEPVNFESRRGDGRARIVTLETAPLLETGKPAVIALEIEFQAPVTNPVIGILIRTRVGLEVFGTNTQLENIPIGPRKPGDKIRIEFHFNCLLAPGEYTLTAATHDPDGTPQDWLDDAQILTVTGENRTAGVVSLACSAVLCVSA